MDFYELLIASVIFVFIFMTATYILGIIIKDNSIVDIAWGLGFVGISVLTFTKSDNKNLVQLYSSFLVILWGVRLSSHILIRRIGKDEDWRYKSFRKKWGKYFYIQSYLKIYMLQGLLLSIIASPLTVQMQKHLII